MKIRQPKYIIEYCSHCNAHRVVYSTGITPCPVCGKLLLPCGGCQECLYEACPFDGKPDEELRRCANSPISKEKAERILKLLVYKERLISRWLRCRSWFFRLTHKKDMNEDWLPF